MNVFDESRLFKRVENQPFTEIDGEIVMLNLENNEYYGFNFTASEIWKLLEKPMTFGEIIDHLLNLYDVSRDRCVDEVSELLLKLLEKKLIVKLN